MSSPISLQFPFDEAAVRALRAGDAVEVSGLLHTGRDRFHKFLGDGGVPPFSLRDGGVFHCGPVVAQDAAGEWHFVAAGPTTSIREEPYMAGIIEKFGLRLILGKGGMGAKTLDACRRCGCVYLQVVGGAAALLAACVKHVDGVDFIEEFGATEASWHIQVEKLPALVGMDANGNSLFDTVQTASAARLAELLRK